jgi:hypothetical protein
MSKIKSKVLRTYDEPTTLVVIGFVDHNENSDVMITDDETGFDVHIGDNLEESFCSGGDISIMNLPEFKMWQKKFSDAIGEDTGFDSFLLPNFKGYIGVTGININNEFITDFDLDNFIKHQVDCSVSLTFPEGTQIVKMENHQIPSNFLI